MNEIRKAILRPFEDSPALYQELVEHYQKVDEYMASDDIPPVFKGQPKSRFDLDDADLRLKIAKHDFVQACAYGNLKRAKLILKRYRSKSLEKEIVNCKDESGYAGLDYACLMCYPEIEKFLLGHGATETEHSNEFREQAKQEFDEFLVNRNFKK